MEQNIDKNQVQENNQAQVPFIEAKVAVSRDGEYLLHFLEDGRIIRKHIHLYKHVLKVPYTRKTSVQVVA